MRNDRFRRQSEKVIAYSTLEELPETVGDQMAHLLTAHRKVAVLYYGGTLGMKPNEHNELVPTSGGGEVLNPLDMKGLQKKVQVVWFPVYPKAIDSTNGRWVHWTSIGNAIKLLYDFFDGFVVAGGTDTMSYLTAALNFMFPMLGKPVVCTGAQRSIFELGDDATTNLYFAVAAAAGDLSGAHLAFANELYHGLRTFKVADRAFKAFESPARYKLGDFDGEVNLYNNAPRRNESIRGRSLVFLPTFREGIKPIKLCPALSGESILHDGSDPGSCVTLLITYGAGNVRDEIITEDEISHVEAIRQLKQMNRPTVLGSPMMDGKVDSPYAPGVAAIKAGAISGQDTCGAALEVKAMRCVALAWDEENDTLNPKRFWDEMVRNHVGEITS